MEYGRRCIVHAIVGYHRLILQCFKVILTSPEIRALPLETVLVPNLADFYAFSPLYVDRRKFITLSTYLGLQHVGHDAERFLCDSCRVIIKRHSSENVRGNELPDITASIVISCTRQLKSLVILRITSTCSNKCTK